MARKYDFEVKDTAEAIRARGKKVDRELKDLARQIDALNHAYLMYFRGVETKEPYKNRQILEKNMRGFKMPTMATTALRFRHTQLLQRLIAFRAYWDRTSRSIEEGTFKFGHGPVLAPLGSTWGESASKDATADTERKDEPQAKPEPAAVEKGTFKELYAQYVDACSGENVRTKAPSYPAFERSLEKQQKAAEAKVGHSSVRYELRMKNGEPKLIAVIKKGG